MVHNLEITILSEYIIFHYVASVIDITQVHIHKIYPERSNKAVFVKKFFAKKEYSMKREIKSWRKWIFNR